MTSSSKSGSSYLISWMSTATCASQLSCTNGRLPSRVQMVDADSVAQVFSVVDIPESTAERAPPCVVV